ncbi:MULTISPECIES: hypothetical protein [unclassified Pseudomonas]|jgi:hypothetical protein|uniref:hypothetical protein n=1 Tax=unclassified Pseudomonas TaxID=196821 RepID=UPI0015B4882A|nr:MULTISPECIES: hypothetical protein [unclassified Pseudomonas]
MISLLRVFSRHLQPCFPKAQARPCENPLFNIILAFWALWHCRHARPPDARL